MTSTPRSGTMIQQHCNLVAGDFADWDDKTTNSRCTNNVVGATGLHLDAYSCLSLLPLKESIRSKGTVGNPSAQCTYSEGVELFDRCAAWLSACSPNAEDIPPTKVGAGRLPQAVTRHIPAWAATLVVRNVPKDASLRELLKVWEPDGSYNLVYYPYNMKSKRRLGYCFINFTTPAFAQEFAEAWHGKPFPEDQCGKVLDITSAKFQGIAPTLELFRGKKIELMNDPEFLPAVFHGTQRQDVRKILLNLRLITMPGQEDGSVRI